MKQSDFPEPPPGIAGKRVLLRRLSESDRPRLRSILAEPGVARWWAPRGADAAVNDRYSDDEVV